MNVINLKEEIKEKLLDINNKFHCTKFKKHKQFCEKILSIFEDRHDIKECCYLIINDISKPICKICNDFTKFKGFSSGYAVTCSRKCAGILVSRNIEIKQKKIDTNIQKYGDIHWMKNKNLLKTFVTNNKNNKCYRKGIQTMIKNYGVSNVFQIESVKNKIKGTNLERYGTENPGSSVEIREKTKKTNLERYGAEYAMQNKEVFERNQRAAIKTRYSFKSFLSPKGRIIWYQGYEKYVIEYLFKSGVNEDDLINERFEVPVIQYEFEGKKRTYFPDIYIKSKNMIIEVKSTYTFDAYIEKNLAKHKASLDSGYDHRIIIWSVKNNCIDQIISKNL